MAQQEWAEAYHWRSLYRENNSRTSTSTGNVSIALPSDFRALAGFPKITFDGTTTEFFPEIQPEEKQQYDNIDKYIMILGDQNAGFTMFINGETLASGASIHIPYYRSVASLVSPANIAMCPNPEYLVQRTLAYIWQAQSDPRFPTVKADADKILQRMLEYEQQYSTAYDNRIITTERKDFGSFRWGQD